MYASGPSSDSRRMYPSVSRAAMITPTAITTVRKSDVPINERFKVELFAEATNVFNINSTVSYGSTTISNTGKARFSTVTGELLVPVSELYQTVFTPSAQESRQGQFGVKFIF